MELSHTPAATAAVFDDPNLIGSAGLVPALRLAETPTPTPSPQAHPRATDIENTIGGSGLSRAAQGRWLPGATGATLEVRPQERLLDLISIGGAGRGEPRAGTLRPRRRSESLAGVPRLDGQAFEGLSGKGGDELEVLVQVQDG